jgi:superfamily II DNA or RNA helicase
MKNIIKYHKFLESKLNIDINSGFNDDIYINKKLYDFQRDVVGWALKKGRGAIFADCGLGKSPMELEWANQVVRKTNKNVLLLTPIAVGMQMKKEAEKFGIEAERSRDGKIKSKITITNYEQLHKFNYNDFIGVICDESSILKNFDGKIKHMINIFMRKVQYRLLGTATAAPNDFIELGTSSEALGYLGYMDMLSKFFKNDQNNCATNRRGRFTESTKWRLKHHAHENFWRWVSSWAKVFRKPSDIGYKDDGYVLPKLIENDVVLDKIYRKPENDGLLFLTEANGLKEQRQERRASLEERCEKMAEIINNKKNISVAWCNLNDEGDLLEKLIRDCIQVSGRDSDESKEEKLISFTNGEIKCLVIKPKIGAWGLNWQHCNYMSFFPTHSYEQYYQAVRRCWRFGQKKKVYIDRIYTQGETNIIKSIKRKTKQADMMFTNLVKYSNALYISNITKFENKMEVPLWV